MRSVISTYFFCILSLSSCSLLFAQHFFDLPHRYQGVKEIYSSNGQSWQYDSEGKLIKYKFKEVRHSITIEYSYDLADSMILKVQSERHAKPNFKEFIDTTRYIYGNGVLLKQLTHYVSKINEEINRYSDNTVFHYDASGRVTISRYESDSQVCMTEWKYGLRPHPDTVLNHCIPKTSEATLQQPHPTEISVTLLSYDGKGRLTSQVPYHLTTGQVDEARYRTYDSLGRLVKEVTETGEFLYGTPSDTPHFTTTVIHHYMGSFLSDSRAENKYGNKTDWGTTRFYYNQQGLPVKEITVHGSSRNLPPVITRYRYHYHQRKAPYMQKNKTKR